MPNYIYILIRRKFSIAKFFFLYFIVRPRFAMQFNLEYAISLLIALAVAYTTSRASPNVSPYLTYFLLPFLVAYIVVVVINNVLPSLNLWGRNVKNYVEDTAMERIDRTNYLQIFPPVLIVFVIFVLLLYNRFLV